MNISNFINVSMQPAASVPIPQNVIGLSPTISSTQVILDWFPSAGATSYQIFSGGCSGTLIQTVTGTTATITGLTPSTSYTYCVKACNTSGCSSGVAINVTTQSSFAITDREIFTSVSAVTASGQITSDLQVDMNCTGTFPNTILDNYYSNPVQTYTINMNIYNVTTGNNLVGSFSFSEPITNSNMSVYVNFPTWIVWIKYVTNNITFSAPVTAGDQLLITKTSISFGGTPAFTLHNDAMTVYAS